MQFDVIRSSVTDIKCDVLILNLFEGVKTPGGATGAVDKALGGAISALIERQGFEGKLGKTLDLTPCGGIGAARVVIVGLGKAEDFNLDRVRRASSAAARKARDFSAKSVASIVHGAGIGGIDSGDAAQALAEGTILGTYRFDRYKTENDRPKSFESFKIVEIDESKLGGIEAMAELGSIIAESVCFARDLVNEPANVVTPTYLADTAVRMAADNEMDCEVMGREGIREAGMNLLLAVAKGSVEEPKFIRMRYNSPHASKTVAIVGKGITFDSGGLNLKPGESMKNMKDDMAGAAAVLAAMKAVARLRPETVNVYAYIPTTENMIGGNATRVGDIITALSGKTVEIDNTDAEGRMVLADAVAVAEREGVDEIIDLATLTGACVVALGRGMAGVLGTDQALVNRLISAGGAEGEVLWQLPLYPEYSDGLKSDVADMKNAGSREAGAILGAIFIKNHLKNTPWAHIDIAGPATIETESSVSPKGATGFGTATLIKYLMGAGR